MKKQFRPNKRLDLVPGIEDLGARLKNVMIRYVGSIRSLAETDPRSLGRLLARARFSGADVRRINKALGMEIPDPDAQPIEVKQTAETVTPAPEAEQMEAARPGDVPMISWTKGRGIMFLPEHLTLAMECTIIARQQQAKQKGEPVPNPEDVLAEMIKTYCMDRLQIQVRTGEA